MGSSWWTLLFLILAISWFHLSQNFLRVEQTRRNSITLQNGYNNQRPLLVLHIGPHKTATTSIQCELTYYRDALARNKDAHLIYLGRTSGCKNKKSNSIGFNLNTQALAQCLDNHVPSIKPCNEQKEWKDSMELLGKLAKEKYNVIVSDEVFSRILPKKESLQLLHITLSQLFQVKVVVGYRRYFEWRLSDHSQKYKRALDEAWPNDGGRKIVPFVTSYRNPIIDQCERGRYREAAEQAKLHPTEYLQQLWSNYSFIVEIFNMHQDGDLVANFVHQVLPAEVSNALEMERKNANRMPKHKNPSESHLFDYDMLAVEAREKGLIPEHKMLSRRMTTVLIQRGLNEFSPDNITRVCLTELELEQLLKRSLLFECHLFPEQSNELSAMHNAEFQKAVDGFRFCNLDIDKMVQDEHILKLFEMIGSKNAT